MSLLRHSGPQERFSRGFRNFLWTRLLGTTANQMLMVALAWQIYDISGSAWDLGLVGLMQFIPALLLTLPAGQWVDRVDRRRVLAPALVSVAELPRAFAASSTLLKLAVIGGPVLGGFLYAFGAAVVYGTCLGFLVVSTLYIAAIPRLPRNANAQPVSLESLFAGFSFIW